MASAPERLRNALIERKARATVDNDLRIALREIDRAKERVLDEKFGEYSSLIQEWWERLRPDEPTFFPVFSHAKARKGRSISKQDFRQRPIALHPRFGMSLQCLAILNFTA